MEDFRYNIPDLQELAESFVEHTPNFITSVDLGQGFFFRWVSRVIRQGILHSIHLTGPPVGFRKVQIYYSVFDGF